MKNRGPKTIGELIRDYYVQSEKHEHYMPWFDPEDNPCCEVPIPKSSNRGEKTMNVNALLTLANSQQKDDLSGYDALPEDLQEALKEEMATEKKDAAKRAAREIIELLKAADISTQSKVNEIREIRKREKALKEKLEKIKRAKAYGKKSNNFLPLMDALGLVSHFQRREIEAADANLLKIPDDFVVEEETAKA